MPKLGLYHDADPIALTTVTGALTRSSAGKLHVRKDNLAASAAPTVNADSTAGYEVGSTWLDTTGGNYYVCSSATEGAAVWLATVQSPVTPGGSDTQIQFNSSGSFAGSSNLTWSSNTLGVTGSVAVTSGAVGSVPLSITAASGQTADLLNVTSYGGTAGDRLKVDASGVTTFSSTAMFSAGTAAAPAIAASSDTDTGLYWSAANTLSIATGGIVRMTIGPKGIISLFGSDAQSATVVGYNNSGFSSGGQASTMVGASNTSNVNGTDNHWFGSSNTLNMLTDPYATRWNTLVGVSNTISSRNWNNNGGKCTAVGYGNTISANRASVFGSNITNTTDASVMVGPLNTAKITITASGTESSVPFVAQAGTFAAPSLTFSGDLNTGIYSPGADQVGVTTAGTLRLITDASGNVGVGTGTTVSARLHAISTTEQLRLGYDASNYASFTVRSGGTLTISPSSGNSVFTGNVVVPQTKYIYLRAEGDTNWRIGMNATSCIELITSGGALALGAPEGGSCPHINVATGNVGIGRLTDRRNPPYRLTVEDFLATGTTVASNVVAAFFVHSFYRDASIRLDSKDNHCHISMLLGDMYLSPQDAIGAVKIAKTTGNATFSGTVEVASDKAFYLGDAATDGTWRFTRSGNNLVIERRESGSYVTKQTIAA